MKLQSKRRSTFIALPADLSSVFVLFVLRRLSALRQSLMSVFVLVPFLAIRFPCCLAVHFLTLIVVYPAATAAGTLTKPL